MRDQLSNCALGGVLGTISMLVGWKSQQQKQEKIQAAVTSNADWTAEVVLFWWISRRGLLSR